MSSYYAGKLPSGNWRVIEEVWKNGKRKHVTVPKNAYYSLGIDPTATFEQVWIQVKQINKEKHIETIAKVNAARRVAKIGFYEDVFFPQDLVDTFTERVRVKCAGSEEHLERLYSHFKFIQEMVMEIKLTPRTYADNAERVFRYMIERQTSVDYSNKLIAMLNMWGRFVAKSHGSFYDDVKRPAKKWRVSIAKSQRQKKGVRRQSERLSPDALKLMKPKLDVCDYNWLFCSLWLGLRPSEVDMLSSASSKLEIIQQLHSGIQILAVNQTKIEGEEVNSGYKYIPLLFPEQEKAIELLRSKVVRRPSVKSIRNAGGARMDTYCGRRGFVDLMQNNGQRHEDASVWMGHKDLKTTMNHYKDPTNVPFTPVVKKKTS